MAMHTFGLIGCLTGLLTSTLNSKCVSETNSQILSWTMTALAKLEFSNSQCSFLDWSCFNWNALGQDNVNAICAGKSVKTALEKWHHWQEKAQNLSSTKWSSPNSNELLRKSTLVLKLKIALFAINPFSLTIELTLSVTKKWFQIECQKLCTVLHMEQSCKCTLGEIWMMPKWDWHARCLCIIEKQKENGNTLLLEAGKTLGQLPHQKPETEAPQCCRVNWHFVS